MTWWLGMQRSGPERLGLDPRLRGDDEVFVVPAQAGTQARGTCAPNIASEREAPAFNPAAYIPALLSILNNRLSSGASDLYLQRFGVGINEWRILTVLKQYPGCTAGFVSEQAAIHLTVISRSLRGLQDKGLVAVDRSAWQRLLALTPVGHTMHDRIARVALRREQRLLQGLSASEVECLRDVLLRLTANLPQVEALVLDDA